jgi:hypothetical protein
MVYSLQVGNAEDDYVVMKAKRQKVRFYSWNLT